MERTAFYSDQGRNGWHPSAGPARPDCRSHRGPTWLYSRHTEGALFTGSDQPARTQGGQGSAVGAAGTSANDAQVVTIKAVLCLCRADHTATQPSCDVPAAPAGECHGRDRGRVGHDPASYHSTAAP